MDFSVQSIYHLKGKKHHFDTMTFSISCIVIIYVFILNRFDMNSDKQTNEQRSIHI